MDDFNEQMEKQIGDIGNDTSMPTKLRIVGNHDTDMEQAHQFNSVTDNIRKKNAIKDEYDESLQPVYGNTIMDGWIPIDRGEMGIRSLFYPSDWEFRVKPASVVAIRNWSSIDEENVAALNNVLNEIIRTCVSINSDMGKISWEKINSWDRFWFIMKVHEYTFKTGEHKIEFDDECNECGETLKFTLKAANLFYEFPDDEVIDRCWNAVKGLWDIRPNDYGVNHKPLSLFIPTLGKDAAIVQWLFAQNQSGKKIDEVFIKFLPFMLERASKDSNILNKQIKDCYNEFNSWDEEMFIFMDEVIRNITINPSEKLTKKCEHCGGEVCSNVRFPNGIKQLFVVQGRHTKFGSK